LARFKGNNTRRPLFFSACVGVGMVLANSKQHFRSKKFAPRSWWSCSEPVQAKQTHCGVKLRLV
jgi:hypothetical protein